MNSFPLLLFLLLSFLPVIGVTPTQAYLVTSLFLALFNDGFHGPGRQRTK